MEYEITERDKILLTKIQSSLSGISDDYKFLSIDAKALLAMKFPKDTGYLLNQVNSNIDCILNNLK